MGNGYGSDSDVLCCRSAFHPLQPIEHCFSFFIVVEHWPIALVSRELAKATIPADAKPRIVCGNLFQSTMNPFVQAYYGYKYIIVCVIESHEQLLKSRTTSALNKR